MINFILDIYGSMSQSIIGTIMFFILAGMILSTILTIAYLISYVIDFVSRPILTGEGKIVNKYFVENGYTEHYHDEYILHIQVGDLIDEYLVSKTNYDKLKNGDFLKVDYSLGRLRKSLYIKSISL
jgi:hypothetical protein